jgi:hypothetical protein
MHSLMNIETVRAEDAWERLAALRELRMAIAALEEACASLVGLVAETTWQSDGVRALHELLEDMHRVASGHVGTITGRVWELKGVNAG